MGIFENSFTILMQVAMVIYDISFDGETAPDVSLLVQKAAIQIGIELLVDLTVILGLVVFQGEDFMFQAKNRYKGYGWTMGMLSMYACAVLGASFMPFLICKDPSFAAATFKFCIAV